MLTVHFLCIQLLHKKSVRATFDIDESEILSQCKNAKTRLKLKAAIDSMNAMKMEKGDEAAVIISKTKGEEKEEKESVVTTKQSKTPAAAASSKSGGGYVGTHILQW